MTYVARVLQRVREAEEELVREAEAQQARWQYRVQDGRVWFDDQVRRAHCGLRLSIPRFMREARLGTILTAPVIYSLTVPLALLDLWVTVYQWVCFPAYGIPRVPRRKYLVIDRGRLGYLNEIEKLNCVFCGYANGLVSYVREVAARTEQYWCPIRHARAIPTPHAHYPLFFDYGDAGRYRNDYHECVPRFPVEGRRDAGPGAGRGQVDRGCREKADLRARIPPSKQASYSESLRSDPERVPETSGLRVPPVGC